MEDCNYTDAHGVAGQTSLRAGEETWNRANELQGKLRQAEHDHGVNSPQAKELHAAVAYTRTQALMEGYQLTGQGERIPGLDRRGGR